MDMHAQTTKRKNKTKLQIKFENLTKKNEISFNYIIAWNYSMEAVPFWTIICDQQH